MNKEAEEQENIIEEQRNNTKKGKKANIGKANKRSQLKKKIKQRGQ